MASSCPICFEEFTQDTVRASPDACEHIFCLPCLEKWSKLGSYCPVDRKRYRKIWNLDSEAVIQVKPRKRKKRTRVLYDFSTKCEICSKDERSDLLLLCDCCDLGFHTTCLSPPLKEVPAGLWFCPPCIAVEAKLKEKNGITKEVEAELSSFDPPKLKEKNLKSIQAKELENFKAKCNKNNTFAEACLNVAVEFENAEVEAKNCQNDDRHFVFEDNESELDKITKTFNFESNKSNKTPFPKNTKSYSHPLVNKKTKNKPSRLSRRNRGYQENSAYSKLDDLYLNTANNNTADGDLLDPLPKDVFYGDMKLDAFSETKEYEFPQVLRNEKLSTTMLPSNSESEPQMILFESFIQGPSDKLNSQEIVEHKSMKLFSEDQSVFEEAVSSEEMPCLTANSCHEESAIERGVEETGNSHPISEDVLSGPKTSTPQPSPNNTYNFIANGLKGIFSKKKNKKKASKEKKKNKKKRSKEKKKNKKISKEREKSRRRIAKEMKKENVSKYEREKRTSKLKAFFLMKYLTRYDESSNSDTNSSTGNYEADISTSDSSSSLFFKKDNEQQYILQKFDKNNDIVNADEKNSMIKNVSSKGLNDVDQEKCTYQPSKSVNTFNLHLHCGKEESNINDTHQKSCTCSHCAPQNTNTNTVNLHLHCDSQTFIKIIPDKNCESAKTDDFNTSRSPDTVCVDSSSIKSEKTSSSKIENFSENHENVNKDLFFHYKDLKYLTVLKDGSFCINRPQSNVCKIETESFSKNKISKNEFKDSMHIKSENDLSSVAKPYLDGKDVKFKASTSLSPASISSSHYSTLYNQPVSSDMIKKEKPFTDSKCSNSEESFSRKDLKHLAIKDGLFVLQVPKCESSLSSLESSNNSKLSTPFCEKKSFCKSDLKHLKIDKDGIFSLDLSDSKSKPSKSIPFASSNFHCDNKPSLDLSDTKLPCQSTDTSTSLTSHCENKSISKADLKHLKIGKDGSFILDLSDPQTKLSCKSTATSTSLTSDCENKSISKADLKHLKIGKDGSFILDVP